MAIFEEKQPGSFPAVMLLLIVFLMAYPLWHLGERELFWNEGEYALAAAELHSFPSVIKVQGQVMTDMYPLFPMLCRGVTELTGASMEFALRFISVLSLFILTLLVGYTCWRADGKQAGLASATIMLTTFLVAEKAVEGYPQMLTVLLLYSGWLLWFTIGMERANWSAAWICAGFFAGLAYYNAGLLALFLFFLPMFFLRRPLAIWPKLKKRGFVAAVPLILLFILLRNLPMWMIPDQNFSSVQGDYFQLSSFLSYLKSLIVYPFLLVTRFFPWSLMLWAPFCAALIPLEHNPLFCKFLRTIIVILGIFFWLSPDTRSRDLLLMVPACSMLLGLSYWIVMRRYGHRFISLFLVIAICVFLLSAAAALFVMFPEQCLNLLPIPHGLRPSFSRFGILLPMLQIGAAAAVSAIAVHCCLKKKPVWMIYLLVFAGTMILFWTIVNPYRAWDRSKEMFAEQIRNVLKEKENLPSENAVVYKDSSISGLYPESFYTGCEIRTAGSSDDFPETINPVYFISMNVPGDPNRNWIQLHDLAYRNRRIYLYKGILLGKDGEKDD